MRSIILKALVGCCILLMGWAGAAEPSKPAAKATDSDLVERVNAARREYLQSLVALHAYYERQGDRERLKWSEEEIRSYHLINKPCYRLDLDVPSAGLEAKANIKEANDLFKDAMVYKDKGTGNDYILNQRRCEILLLEILQKYPTSDKIADVAYQLGELYEGRAYRHFDRAALYFERVAQWKKGSRTDARLRAAVIYDRILNERTKAIEMYRDEIANDTDPERIQFAERRLAELTAPKK